MPDIDNLSIRIESSVEKALPSFNSLIETLNTLNNSLNGSGTAFGNFATSVKAAANSVRDLNTSLGRVGNLNLNVGVDTSQISRAGENLRGAIPTNLPAGNAKLSEMVRNMSSLSGSTLKLGQAVRNVSGHVTSFFKTIGNGAVTGLKGSMVQLKAFADSINPFAKRVKTATLSISGLVNAFWRLYTRIFMARRIISLFTTAINKSTNYIESYHYFDVATKKIGEQAKDAFSEMGYDSAEEYARSFRDRALELNEKMSGYRFDDNGYASSTGNKSLGLDSDQLLQYQAQYAQMADSIGMSGEAALATSKALTMLAGDWSSLRNIDFSTAYEKMSSALAGQARAVRSLGIDITQASLAQTAANIGIETSVQKMNQSEKAMLRMITMIQQSKVAWGDLANTLNTPANQMRMLRQNLQALARTFGNLFLPIVAKVIPYINGLVIALQRLFQWLARLLGINPGKLVTSLGGVDDSLGDLGDLAEDDPIGDLADDADDAGDALDDANEAAKELRRTILSFDELNVLNSPDTSSSTGTGGDNGKDKDDDVTGLSPEELGLLDQSLLDALDEYEKAWNKAFENMQSKALEFAKRLEGIGRAIKWFVEQGRWREMGQYLADLANKGLKKLFDAVNWEKIQSKIIPAIHGLAEAFNGFIGRLDWGAIGSWIAGAINTLFGSLYEWYKTFDWAQLGARLRDGFTSMIEGIDWSYIGGYLGAKFMSAWRLLGGFVSRFPAVETGKALATLLNSAIAEINELEITNALVNVVNNAVTALGSFLEDFDPNNDLAKKLGNGFNNFFANVDWKEAGKTLSGVINKAFDELNTFILEFDWGAFTIALGEGINSFIDGLDVENAAGTLNSFFTNVLNSIKESDVDWKELGRKVADFIGGINWLDHLLTVKDIIKEALGGFFSGLLSEALGDFGENFADGFVEGVSSIIDLGAGAVEGIANALQALADVLGALPPDVVRGLGKALAYFFAVKIADGFVTGLLRSVVGFNVFKDVLGGGVLATLVYGVAGSLRNLINVGIPGLASSVGTLATKFSGLATSLGLVGTAWATFEATSVTISENSMGNVDQFATSLNDALSLLESNLGLTAEQMVVVREKMTNIASAENWYSAVEDAAIAFGDVGVSAEELSTILGDNVDSDMQAVIRTMENLEAQAGNAKSALSVSGLDSYTLGYEDVKTAIKEVGDEFGTSQLKTEGAISSLKSQDGTITTASGWFEALAEKLGLTGEKAEAAASMFNNSLVGSLQGLATESENAKNKADPLNAILDGLTKETSWSDSVKMALIVGALGTLAENGQDADGKLTDLSSKLDVLAGKTSFSEMVGGISAALQTAGTDSTAFYDALVLAIQNTEGAVPDSIANIKTSLEGSGEELSSSAKTAFANVGTGAQAGIDESIPYIEESVGNMANDIPAVFEETLEMHSPSKVMERSALNVGEGTAGGIDKSIPKVKEASKKMGNAIPTTIKEAFNAEKGSMLTSLGEMVNAIVEKFNTIKQDISMKFDGLGYSISSAIGDLSPVGRDASMAVANGIGSALYEVQNRANEIPGIISSSLSGLYQMGESLGREFAIGLNNGIASQHISIPHIVYAGDSIHTYEGGTIAYPNFNVQWYAKGGLFNKPTLAGFGEAGAEAALPLSNKSVMAQIAKAITESGGYGGFSPEDMTEAVATGVAMAMSQNPQTVEIIVNSILKTNDEAIAQSVERGRARLDMRYNATPSYNY